MKITRLGTDDPMAAHDHAAMTGWVLVGRGADAPEHAIGRYERRGVLAYLIREASGELALVSGWTSASWTWSRGRS
jgi:hypothetical protein